MWYLGDIGQQTLEMHTADLNNYCAGLQLAYAIDSLMSTERVTLFSQKPKQQLLAENRRNAFGTSDSYCEFGNFFHIITQGHRIVVVCLSQPTHLTNPNMH